MAAIGQNGHVEALNGQTNQAQLSEERDTRELQRQRELDEAKARAAQMVKTMKWWSECTANWREKWIKVRNERNKAREEIKQLRVSLDAANKKSKSYKHEKKELELQVFQLKQEMEQVHDFMMTHTEDFSLIETKNSPTCEEVNGRDFGHAAILTSQVLKNVNSEDGLVTNVLSREIRELEITPDSEQNVTEPDPGEMAAEEKRLIQQLSKDDDFDEQLLLQKISKLELHLDQAEQIIKSEQAEKTSLQKKGDKLQKENEELRARQDQLYASKQDAVRELLTIQELHRAEINIVNKALQDEMKSRETFENKSHGMRQELEHAKSCQSDEYNKRERLEIEKMALERRNKMLSTEVRYYQELFDHKGLPKMWKCERCGAPRPSSGAF